jgi:hypothetical protein
MRACVGVYNACARACVIYLYIMTYIGPYTVTVIKTLSVYCAPLAIHLHIRTSAVHRGPPSNCIPVCRGRQSGLHVLCAPLPVTRIRFTSTCRGLVDSVSRLSHGNMLGTYTYNRGTGTSVGKLCVVIITTRV